jgi:hypothetical protein
MGHRANIHMIAGLADPPPRNNGSASMLCGIGAGLPEIA